jgi:hypothetical protein
MQQVEDILKSSKKYSKKDNSILNVVKEMVYEQELEVPFGEMMWKYLLILNRKWIQASIAQKNKNEYSFMLKNELASVLLEFCAENSLPAYFKSHLLNLNSAIFNVLNTQLTEYNIKMCYLESKCKKFKNRFII